jgi:Zn-dependent protease with chaperone function
LTSALVAPAVVVGLPFLVIGRPVIALVVAVVAVVVWMRVVTNPEPRVVAAMGAVPADAVVYARLHNLTDSLCTANGLPKPAIYVIDDPARNAAAWGRDPRRAGVVATTGLLDALDRIELEGVLANELARIKTHATAPGTLAVTPFTFTTDLARRLAGPRDDLTADQAGVALTRYPPGLLGALQKMAAGSRRPVSGWAETHHLWLVADEADPVSLESRIAALQEL